MQHAGPYLVRDGAQRYWDEYIGREGRMDSQNFCAFLAATCRRVPDKPALVHRGHSYSYAELFDRIAGTAKLLNEQWNIAPGSRVALLMENSDLYNIFYLGILAANIVAVPLNTKLTRRELEYMLIDSAAVLLLSESRFEGVLKELKASGTINARFELIDRSQLPARADWRALVGGALTHADAAIYYTSGTTGHPKGVVHTHESLIAGTIQGPPSWEYDELNSINLAISPLFHIANHTVFLPTFKVGGTLVVDTFKVDEIFALIEKYSVTHLFAVPSMLLLMLDLFREGQAAATSVRGVAFGAAPMPAHMLRAVQAMFPNAHLVHGMGQTECCGTIVTLPSDRAFDKAGSVGINIAGMDIMIVDDRDVELAAGQVGELVARGPNVMSRYLNREQATAETLRGGWLHTGDLGYRDEQGFVFLVDRAKDMIIRGGENIYSTEVEQVLLSHPDIANVAVIGVPSAIFGEEVMACIVKRDGRSELSLEDIHAHCRSQLAKYKMPASIRYFEALPQTATGKIQKNELKKMV